MQTQKRKNTQSSKFSTKLTEDTACTSIRFAACKMLNVHSSYYTWI